MGVLKAAELGALATVDAGAPGDDLGLVDPSGDQVGLAGRLGIQKLWITSCDFRMKRTGTPTGRWTSLAVSKLRLGCGSTYFTCHQHCFAVISTVSSASR